MPGTTDVTLLNSDDEHTVGGQFKNDTFLVDPEDLQEATGWRLKERGLCREDTCVPVGDRSSLQRNGNLDLEEFADLLNRPLATELDPPAAYLGPPTDRVKSRLESGQAPDFTLPDWNNEKNISLSDFEGNKIFLLVWASW